MLVDMWAVTAVERLGGAALRSELTTAGVTRSQLAAALESGRGDRLARGVYAVKTVDPAMLTIKTLRATPACITEAQRLGLWVLHRPDKPHASVNHGRELPGLVVHRAAGPVDVVRMCIQCLRCLPELEALCIVESAVVRGMVKPAELRTALTGQRDRTALKAVSLVNPHSQSLIETVARYHLLAAGYSVQAQVYIPRVGRLDLFIDGLLGLEVDRRRHHSNAAEFAEDRRRWNLLTSGGIRVLRVTYSMLVHAADDFLALVAKALTAQ